MMGAVAILRPFDPQSWLEDFEVVGGGFLLRDHLMLTVLYAGRPAQDHRTAHRMLSALTPAQREALVAHLSPLKMREAEHG